MPGITIADLLKAPHQNRLPAAVLDEPALRLRVVEGGKKAPRRRRRRRPRTKP